MNENRKKKSLIFLMILSICIVIVAIYLKYHNQNTLKVGVYSGSSWGVPGTSYYEMFQDAIDRFHEKYPNINIEFEEGIPVDDYSEWLSGEILKGEEPDVYLVLPDDFSVLVKIGALENLNAHIMKDSSFKATDFYNVAYEAGNHMDRQYALPFECNPKLMFVNKKLLKEKKIAMPSDEWTWNDFYTICKDILTDENGDGLYDQYGYYDYTWQDAVYSNGTIPFSEDGSDSNFTDKNVIDSIAFLKKLMELHKNHLAHYTDFDLGNVAFRPLSFSEYRTYMPYPWRIKKFSQFDWNCIPMPAGPSGDNTSSMETLLLGMSTRTVNKEKAWEFMKILTTDKKIQQSIYRDAAGASPLKKVTSSQAVNEILNADMPKDSRIDLSLLDEVLKNAVNINHFSEYRSATQYANSFIADVLEKEEELNLAMFQLKKDMKKIIH